MLHSSIQLTPGDRLKDARISHAKYLASYNWLEREQGVILVPGAPPTWCPPASEPALKPDAGSYFRDPNAARYPSYPFEPGIRSIFALHPDFSGQDIDLVACGNTVGSLLAFVSGIEKTFRMGVEKVGNTVFLLRRENSPRELIKGVYGYGHTFPESYTQWDPAVKGSASHQRLVQYTLCDLRCIIRSESDGYLPEKVQTSSKSANFSGVDSEGFPGLAELAVSTTQTVDGALPIRIRPSGSSIPQSAIFDLKTRAKNNIIRMNEMLSRLWLNQTPNFIVAYHTKGVFDDIRILDIKSDVQDWERRNGILILQLLNVLRKIRDIVNKQEKKKVELRRMAQGDLAFWSEPEARAALPTELRKKWMGQEIIVDEQIEGDSDVGSSDDENADYLKF